MNILGIYGLTDHDSSAAFLKDGKVTAAAAEERFSRVKHDAGFPFRAIQYCLNSEGVSINDIDYVAIGVKLSLKAIGPANTVLKNLKTLNYSRNIVQWVSFYKTVGDIYRNLEEVLRDRFGYRNRVVAYEHHLAHAANVFFPSPFQESAIMVVDGTGERKVASFFLAKERSLLNVGQVVRPHSIGLMYSEITKYLGFDRYKDEYKVMGLSAYGAPTLLNKMSKLVRLNNDGSYELDLSYFRFYGDYINGLSKKFYDEFGPSRKMGEDIDDRMKDIAWAVQQVTEDVICHMANHLHEKTGSDNLCLSGGVALNGRANYAILKRTPFKRLFINSDPDDIGTSIGAAMLLHYQLGGQRPARTMESVFLGPGFTDKQITTVLNDLKISYSPCPDPARRAAELIAEGNLIGWFQGRMVWGQRALGNRSILADPRQAAMKDKINKCVKYREEFRPFAPAVLYEEADKYFDMPQPDIPYMNIVVPVREEMKGLIPAVTHVDGTARVQTVTQENNLLFWRLIRSFGDITGVPVVLNTSFNVKGEPIVCSPEDAIRCFFATGLDHLIIGNFIVSKKGAK